MAVLTSDDIGDLVKGTLRRLKPVGFGQIATRLNDYPVMRDLLKKEKVQFDSGRGWSHRISTTTTGNARQVGMFQPDSYGRADTLQEIEGPWRHTTTNYMFDRRELLMNRGWERLTKILSVLRFDAMVDLAQLLEDQFWGGPSSSSDKLAIWGVPYWIVTNATDGFNGGAPSGWTTVGNLSPTTYQRWRNWTGRYAEVTKTDLVRKMREGFVKTKFKSPTPFPDIRRAQSRRHRIFAPYDVIASLEEILEQQNDALGNNIASKDGMVQFRGVPFERCETLESLSNSPIYMLDMNTIFPIVLKGDFLREDGPEKVPNQHNSMKVDIDMTWNLKCVDRRSNAVFDTGA